MHVPLLTALAALSALPSPSLAADFSFSPKSLLRRASNVVPYSKKVGPLDTPWTSQVSTSHPWPEYPRPQMRRPVASEYTNAIRHDFHGFTPSWLNLNGIWLYNGTNTTTQASPPTALEKGAFGNEILVPFPPESSLSGIETRSTYNWYLKEFKTADLFPSGSDASSVEANGRVFINFGAVDWESAVFLNGHNVGFHRGGYLRFSFDVSDYLNWSPDETNTLEVYAFDPTDTLPLEYDFPIGKQTANPSHIFYTSTSGIWQTVWLELVPRHHILNITLEGDMNGNVNASVFTQTSPVASSSSSSGSGSNSSSVSGSGSNSNSGSDSGSGSGGSTPFNPKPVTLTFFEPGTAKPFFSTKVAADKVTSFQVPKDKIKLWGPGHPTLYNVTAEWNGDVVQTYLGFRTIEKGTLDGVVRPLLNGEFVFQFGTLDQGFWPDGIYSPPTYDAMVFDLHTLQNLGMNFLRKHIKVESDLYYEATDKAGLLVWQDQPSLIPSDSYTFTNNCTTITILPDEAQKEEFEKELTDMINLHKGHPSIITWVLLNEGWGEDPTNATWPAYLTQIAHEADPTRLINSATGWFAFDNGDFSDDHHYSGPQCGSPFYSIDSSPYDPSKIGVQGEFGGLGLNTTADHLWKVAEAVQQINQTYEIDLTLPAWNYRALQVIEQLRQQTEFFSCSAGVYTQTTDVEGEVNGLTTYDRRVLRPYVEQWRDLIHKLYATAASRASGPPKGPFGEANVTAAIPMLKRDLFGMGEMSGEVEL